MKTGACGKAHIRAAAQQRTFIKKAPEVFKPCSGAWGRQGYTNVYLAVAKPGIVRDALDAAAKNVGSRAKKKKG